MVTGRGVEGMEGDTLPLSVGCLHCTLCLAIWFQLRSGAAHPSTLPQQMELVSAPRLTRTLTRHHHPASALRYRSVSPGAVQGAEELLVPPPQRVRPSALLFLAGSPVIKYEALQEKERLLPDVSMPVLDVVKSWAPVTGVEC